MEGMHGGQRVAPRHAQRGQKLERLELERLQAFRGSEMQASKSVEGWAAEAEYSRKAYVREQVGHDKRVVQDVIEASVHEAQQAQPAQRAHGEERDES